MAKFKKGDRVRCVERDFAGIIPLEAGRLVYVEESQESTFLDQSGNLFWTYRWELDNDTIPETVTVNGVEYVRKPEPEHVWAWGQWARVNKSATRGGEIVFVTGPVKDNGFVPITYKDCDGMNHTDGCLPTHLTYIGTADIPR